MSRKLSLILSILSAMLFTGLAVETRAQVASAVVVATCGTASYTAGKTAAQTQNTSGLTCGSATATIGPIPAGTNVIGKIDINQTTPGTTNGVVVNSSALPTGAATSALQTSGNASLTTIASNTTSAATAARQDTGNGSLATIASNTTDAATGTKQDTGNASLTTLITNTNAFSFGHIDSNATTTLKSGAGVLGSICVNTRGAALNTATVYDNTAGSGAVVAVFDTTVDFGCFNYTLNFGTGLTVVTATGTPADLTITYR